MNVRNSPAALAIAAAIFVAGCGGSGGVTGTPGTPSPSASPLKILTAFTLSGGEQNVIPLGTPATNFTPDEHISFQRQPNGTYKMWAASGPFGDYGYTTPDLFALTPMKSNGTSPASIFAQSGAGTTAYDADYAGSGTILTAANGTDLLMFYHAENHLFSGTDYQTLPFYASVGLARSTDGGLTWSRQGAVITGADPQQSTQPATGAGALTPTAVEMGGYIYVFYREIDLQSNVTGLAIARAPIASDGAPGSFQKYLSGSFSSPGLGGATTPLDIVLDPANKDLRQPHVSFNTYLNQYLMSITGNGGIYVLTSIDLINWSSGILVLPAPAPDSTVVLGSTPFNWYPTIVSPSQASDQLSGQTGFLYYAKSNGTTSQHVMYRQAFTITGV